MSDGGLKCSLCVIISTYAYLPRCEVLRCLKAITRDTDRLVPRGETCLRTLPQALATGRARAVESVCLPSFKMERRAARRVRMRAPLPIRSGRVLLVPTTRDMLGFLRVPTPALLRPAVRSTRAPLHPVARSIRVSTMRRRAASATTRAITRV